MERVVGNEAGGRFVIHQELSSKVNQPRVVTVSL